MESDSGRRGSCFFLELERRARIYKRVVILVYAHTLYMYIRAITMRSKFNGQI